MIATLRLDQITFDLKRWCFSSIHLTLSLAELLCSRHVESTDPARRYGILPITDGVVIDHVSKGSDTDTIWRQRGPLPPPDDCCMKVY